MRASSRECPISSIGVEDQQARTATEAEDFSAVRLEIAQFGGHNLVAAEIKNRWRDEVTEHGIQEGNQRGQYTATQEEFDGAAARSLSVESVISTHWLHLPPNACCKN